MWRFGVRGQRSEVGHQSYRGLGVDQSADVRWRQEADLLQQVAELPEHSSDLRDTHTADMSDILRA